LVEKGVYSKRKTLTWGENSLCSQLGGRLLNQWVASYPNIDVFDDAFHVMV